MLQAIIFDLGQVLIRFTPDLFFDRLSLPAADRPLFAREVFRSVEWVALDRGVITEQQAVASVCERLPHRLHPAVERLLCHWWEDPIVPVEGMAQLLGELKEAGYRLYLLSNATLRLPTYFPRVPGSEYFDGVVFSAQHRQLKPEREIYQTLLSTFSLSPACCLFVDDLPANVEGARFAGMEGILFRDDLPRLRRELRRCGVNVACP